MSGRRIDTKDLPAILAALREHIRRIGRGAQRALTAT
jgi:hypothetical protein